MRKKKRMLEMLMTALILTASFYVGQLGASITTSGQSKETETPKVKVYRDKGTKEADTAAQNAEGVNPNGVWFGKTVVIDPGHGGMDGGKIGTGGEVEKEINLQISGKLKTLLEQNGITVIMTRENDEGLYDEDEPNKKQQDMKRRCELINSTKPEMVISVHQNSYTEASVRGPQVFYYENSAEAKEIAAVLQTSLNELLEIQRPREIKANDSYYILRKTERPTVIVECGFLSNPEEAALLSTAAYQQRVAEAICAGVLQCLEKSSSNL